MGPCIHDMPVWSGFCVLPGRIGARSIYSVPRSFGFKRRLHGNDIDDPAMELM
jgi:hypothetical protein